MIKGSVDSVESMGLVDGPGIRAVVFLTGCRLRCKYCHNPESWVKRDDNYTAEEVLNKVLRFKPYFKRNNGGVTFSGGEPLLQEEFLIETCKLLKQNNIHIALDTAGIGNGRYEEILENVDLILFDVKHVTSEGYKDLTGGELTDVFDFLSVANKMRKKFWIRQVIVPGVMDNDMYLEKLNSFIKTHIIASNIEKIEFLPYHTLGKEKYEKMGLKYPLNDLEEMDKEKCEDLYNKFMELYNKKN